MSSEEQRVAIADLEGRMCRCEMCQEDDVDCVTMYADGNCLTACADCLEWALSLLVRKEPCNPDS
jgi:hypothetical protein